MKTPAVNSPHGFEEFLSGQREPILIVGSGLSFGYVPLLDKLVTERKVELESKLHTADHDISNGPYQWAGAVLAELESRAEPLPRLRLAEALGLLDDPKWTASCGLPLRGTLPRHRVIARFARERLWKTICSLNWDTYIEHALLRIGFQQNIPEHPQPWLSAFYAIVLSSPDRVYFGRNDCLSILKPHGCVNALNRAKEAENNGANEEADAIATRFKITEEDLKEPHPDNPDDKWFYTQIGAQLGQRPLMVACWSISEPYLQTVINDTLVDQVTRGTPGELTIVDIHFNCEGHTKAAEIYALERDQVFSQIEPQRNGFNADQFFLWLQARYAMREIRKHAATTLREFANRTEESLKKPIFDHHVISWTDSFLPAWTRLCWRSRVVKHRTFEPHMIRLDLEDSHVPLYPDGIDRPDLTMALNILWEIEQLHLNWNYEKFPGGLYDEATTHLVVPLPCDTPPDNLSALARTIDVLESDLGYVTKMSILPVPIAMDSLPQPDSLDVLREGLARQMRVARFADPRNIKVIDISAAIEALR